ncbi:unnamed protein product [Pedinophyceae sp. YPF-701]|nr:unnamed protein product [Pedinophyceae sp. YPF-701]
MSHRLFKLLNSGAKYKDLLVQTAQDALPPGSHAAIDRWYAALMHSKLTDSFFTDGWGNFGEQNLMDEVDAMRGGVDTHVAPMDISWEVVGTGTLESDDVAGRPSKTRYELLQGSFRAQCSSIVFQDLPPEVQAGRCQLVRPVGPPGGSDPPPHATPSLVVHLPGTGDHSFARRLAIASPLLHHGVASLSLEGPYYGLRRPEGQQGCRLRYVADLFRLGRVTIEEAMRLMHWAEHNGYERVGTSGLSMGGVHACYAASMYPRRASCAPLLAPHSAAPSYCLGLLSQGTAWEVLKKQFPSAGMLRAQMGRGESLGELWEGSKTMRHAAHSLAQAHIAQDVARENTTGSVAAEEGGPGEASTDAAGAGGSAWGAAAVPSWLPAAARDLDIIQEMLRGREGGVDETILLLWEIMNRFTDLTQLPPPLQPEATILVGATEDEYVPPSSTLKLAKAWGNREVRWVKGGHVSSFVIHFPAFRAAILDSLLRLK